jgi:hypothetical protein
MPYLSAFHRAISASTAFWAAPERLARVSIEHGVRSETVGSRHHHPHSRGAEISSPEQSSRRRRPRDQAPLRCARSAALCRERLASTRQIIRATDAASTSKLGAKANFGKRCANASPH